MSRHVTSPAVAPVPNFASNGTQKETVPVLVLIALTLLAGCHPQQPFYFKHVDNELAYYKGVATEIDYPDVEAKRLAEVSCDKRPWSLQNMDTKNLWDLSLEEAVQIALANSKVVRFLAGAPSDNIPQEPIAPSYLLASPLEPQNIQTVYDPAYWETDPGADGRPGVEAALSAFDAQLSSSLTWEKIDTPENVNPAFVSLGSPEIDNEDRASFQTRISKVTATGGTFALTHNVIYDLNNSNFAGSLFGPPYAYKSDFNVNLIAEARQPLLRGAGVQFNRINGPGTQAGPGNYRGVMIARVNTDMELARFETNVQRLVVNVEQQYWELYYQYRALDSVIKGRDSALQTWRKIYTLYRVGGKGGEADKEAQAREQYYIFRSNAETTLNGLYQTEANLRYLLGLASTDGRLIRPKDEPTIAKVTFDWYDVQAEALARNADLRALKWYVKRRELELIAAKNYLLPQLDAVAQYSWLGLGNNLFPEANGAGSNFTLPGSAAYESLTNGQFQQWQVGLQFSMPLGFRKEMSGVRNAQIALAREKVKLQEGELELSHQLAFAIRDLETDYVLSQTDFNRRIAAQRQVEAVQAAYETDTITLDVLLRAQQELAAAESAYYRALVNYNRAIATVHLRKGSLLEYNGVYLAEGPWPGKAYFDARRRARARAASTYLDYGFTNPRVVSRGPYDQFAGRDGTCDGSEVSPAAPPPPAPEPASTKPKQQSQQELVPTPDPETSQPAASPADPQTSVAPKGQGIRTVAMTPATKPGSPDTGLPQPGSPDSSAIGVPQAQEAASRGTASCGFAAPIASYRGHPVRQGVPDLTTDPAAAKIPTRPIDAAVTQAGWTAAPTSGRDTDER